MLLAWFNLFFENATRSSIHTLCPIRAASKAEMRAWHLQRTAPPGLTRNSQASPGPQEPPGHSGGGTQSLWLSVREH